MIVKWDEISKNDPAYNVNLSLERQDFGFEFSPKKQQK